MNTVSRRFGSSTLTSLRLFSRAPCTRIRSWLSATCGAGDFLSVLVAVLIVSPSVYAGPPGRPSPSLLDLTRVGQLPGVSYRSNASCGSLSRASRFLIVSVTVSRAVWRQCWAARHDGSQQITRSSAVAARLTGCRATRPMPVGHAVKMQAHGRDGIRQPPAANGRWPAGPALQDGGTVHLGFNSARTEPTRSSRRRSKRSRPPWPPAALSRPADL